MRFATRTALVTGAAGGIGSRIACALVEEGARVVATDRSLPANGTLAIAADLTNAADLARLAEHVREFGSPDIVVGAAGASIHAAIIDTSLDEWQGLHAINTLANVALLQAFAPAMQTAGRGSFVFVSSINAAYATPSQGAYAATKAALDSVVKTAALELAPHGIRVNSVRPASVDTTLLRTGLARTGDPDTALTANVKRHPLGRIGTIDDVARLVLFLASDDASWVTGQSWMIDGGASITRR
jgi:NAD(P)-dependent dehydrogenase (short-subunit alcohol dehydrogenase family)